MKSQKAKSQPIRNNSSENSIVNVNYTYSHNSFQIYITTYFFLIHISLNFFSPVK